MGALTPEFLMASTEPLNCFSGEELADQTAALALVQLQRSR